MSVPLDHESGVPGGSFSLSDFLAAKRLVGEIGLEKAQAALIALAKLSL